MGLWLIGRHHGREVRRLLSPGMYTVGRTAESDLVLASQTVSRSHAEITVEGGRVQLTDLDSLNGTRVNGQPLDPGAPCELRAGDAIEFGSVVVRLSDDDGETSPSWSDDDCVSEILSRSPDDALEVPATADRLLRLMLEAGRLLLLPGDPARTFDPLLELVGRAIPADRIIVLLCNDDGAPVQRAARVRGRSENSPLVLSRTMIRMVLEQGKSFRTQDARVDPRFMGHESVMCRSAMAAPLEDAEEILGALYVDTDRPDVWSEFDLSVLVLLSRMLGSKVAGAAKYEELQELVRIRYELEQARRIQSWLLARDLPHVAGYEFARRQDMCAEVGGDFFDVHRDPSGRISLVLGDVTGKGLGAALLMSDLLATVRALLRSGGSPVEVVTHVHRHLVQTTAHEISATLFIGVTNPKDSRLEYASAGHPPALLMSPAGEMERLGAVCPPAGFDVPFAPEIRFADFGPGSHLVVYSDGVTEAQAGDCDFFGDARLEAVVRQSAGKSAEECVRAIEAALDTFLGDAPQTDDVTLLVARRSP